MLNKLREAAQAGERFRDNLAQTSLFNTTKWFDGIASSIKPAVFAVAVASGASGCATVSHEIQHSGPTTTYEKWVAETQYLEKLPRDELMQLMAERPETAAFKDLDRIDVQALSERIAAFNNGTSDEHPLRQSPMRLENPYAGNQPIQVTLNDNIEGTKIVAGMMHQDPDMIEILTEGLSGINYPAALTATPKDSGLNSYLDATLPGSVMLPENFNNPVLEGLAWASAEPENRPENLAFIIYHELAHPHVTQKMIIHSGDIDDDKVYAQALKGTYETTNETHSHLTAALSINKQFDLTPAEFKERLENLKGYDNGNVLNGGLTGPQQSNNPTTRYRAGKAIEVIQEMVERDPDFLKNLTYEEIPFVAYDITKSAGYYHNAAEMMLATGMSHVAPALNQANKYSDMHLARDILRVAPDNTALKNAEKDLTVVWENKTQLDDLKAMKAALDTRPGLDGQMDGDQIRRSLGKNINSWTAFELIQEHLPEPSDNRANLNDNLEARLSALAADVDQALSGLPDKETLDIRRADVLVMIQGELKDLNTQARSDDPYHKVADGKKQFTEEIASNLMINYSDTFEKANEYVADYEASLSDEERLAM